MADMEALGYLDHPHTSAGRVPTDEGYRFYVDSLMGLQPLARGEQEAEDGVEHHAPGEGGGFQRDVTGEPGVPGVEEPVVHPAEEQRIGSDDRRDRDPAERPGAEVADDRRVGKARLDTLGERLEAGEDDRRVRRVGEVD